MVDVVHVYFALVPSLLHQNHIGITHVGTSNFKMELVRPVPLYFVAMPQSIITVTKLMFISSLIHIVDGVRSITKFVSLYEDITGKVSKVFVNQPLDPRRGDSNLLGPLRPPKYFGLPMVN